MRSGGIRAHISGAKARSNRSAGTGPSAVAATAETTFRLWVRQFPSTWDFYVLSVGGLGPLVEHGQELVALDVEVGQ